MLLNKYNIHPALTTSFLDITKGKISIDIQFIIITLQVNYSTTWFIAAKIGDTPGFHCMTDNIFMLL